MRYSIDEKKRISSFSSILWIPFLHLIHLIEAVTFLSRYHNLHYLRLLPISVSIFILFEFNSALLYSVVHYHIVFYTDTYHRSIDVIFTPTHRTIPSLLCRFTEGIDVTLTRVTSSYLCRVISISCYLYCSLERINELLSELMSAWIKKWIQNWMHR